VFPDMARLPYPIWLLPFLLQQPLL